MAFKLYSTDDGHVPAWEYLPTMSIRPRLGLGLIFDSTGQLKVSTTPQYICMREEEKAVTAGTIVPVVKITKDQVWESELDSTTAFDLGTACDVASGGLLVDADGLNNRNFMITYLEGKTAGSVVRGRFIASNI